MAEQLKRKKDLKGRFVRLLKNVETRGSTIFFAGTVLKVFRNFDGLWLEAVTRCPTCEIVTRHIIQKVEERKVYLLPVGYQPTKDETPAQMRAG
jgi:hypothetical protein